MYSSMNCTCAIFCQFMKLIMVLFKEIGVVISNIYNDYLKDTPPVAHVQLFPRIYNSFFFFFSLCFY